MTRTDLEQYIGWTLVAVGGDIIHTDDPDDKPSKVRLRLQSPERRLVDVYIETGSTYYGETFLEFEKCDR